MAAKTYQMFIGGKWVDAANGKTFEDMNPYTGEVYAYLQAGKREDAMRAIEAAQAAFSGWASTPPYGVKTSTEETKNKYPSFPTIYEQKSKLTMLEIWSVILKRSI
jgi:hypothetical protein